eukprot:6924784-Pyramimonas_sp.AAC.1
MSTCVGTLEKEAEVKVTSFIDGGSCRAGGPRHAIRTARATTASLEFDEHAGAQTNFPQTKHFATSLKAETVLRAALTDSGHENVQVVRNMVLVGGEI